MRLYDLSHIVISIGKLKLCYIAMLCINILKSRLHQFLSFLKLKSVMISYYILKFCILYVSGHFVKHKEAFSFFGMLRSLLGRKQGVELHSHIASIDHNIFCSTGMNTFTLYCKYGSCGIKAFILELTQLTAVHSISKISSKALNIKVVCTVTYFLIRCECYLDIAMLYLGMCHKIFYGCHDFCYTCLIVCTE